MKFEIERKFLIISNEWRKLARGVKYRQGYLSTMAERVVRVRTIGNIGFLSVKGRVKGIRRLEYEYEIPIDDANDILNHLCERPIIEKIRYKINYQGFVWEIDEFLGENQGLILAEVELQHENQKIELPHWVGDEVSEDQRYFNYSLVKHPYKNW